MCGIAQVFRHGWADGSELHVATRSSPEEKASAFPLSSFIQRNSGFLAVLGVDELWNSRGESQTPREVAYRWLAPLARRVATNKRTNVADILIETQKGRGLHECKTPTFSKIKLPAELRRCGVAGRKARVGQCCALPFI
ncbi:hypothetical protein Pla144_24200 [Bythopirellula polymerisocia]|uniref:Uncharacterized protein n=1 Tax=Bythopirellula polymerisocia TaxID=2528003 RepID=A0A5C6CRU2_9BACT|nr:hypothetical protein Pla144_24200 [Bythopirellula polymerisocia]